MECCIKYSSNFKKHSHTNLDSFAFRMRDVPLTGEKTLE